MRTRHRGTMRMAVAGLATAAGLALAGCGGDDPEPGTDVEDIVEDEVATSPAPDQPGEMTAPARDPYIGPYNRQFYDEMPIYDGQEVTLDAEIEQVVSTDSPTAFTISDPEDTELGDLLVIAQTATPDLAEDQVVQVVGTVHADFQLTEVEAQLALDLDDEQFEDFEGGPYLEATEITLTEGM